MSLLSSLFSDSVGLSTVFTLGILFLIPIVIMVYILRSMKNLK